MSDQRPERFLDTLRKEREKYDSKSQAWRILYFISWACAFFFGSGAILYSIFNLGHEQDNSWLLIFLALLSISFLGVGISYHQHQAIKKQMNIIDKIKEDLSKMSPALVQLRNEIRDEAGKISRLEGNHRLTNLSHKRNTNNHRDRNRARPD
jgi:superfamily I DNA/RNA helicase